MNDLYLQLTNAEPPKLSVKSVIPYFVLKYLKSPAEITLRVVSKVSEDPGLEVLLPDNVIVEGASDNSWIATCELPILFKREEQIGYSGVCCVCRQLLKIAGREDLLGYKGTSLNGTSEASVWTKFCEVDLLNCLKDLISKPIPVIPQELAQFEFHLSTPTKVHNYFKLARKIARETRGFSLRTMPGMEDLKIVDHKYAEGHAMTVADLVLFFCYSIVFRYMSPESLEKHVPLTLTWFRVLESTLEPLVRQILPPSDPKTALDVSKSTLPEVSQVSLYKTETRKHNQTTKKFTKQENIDVPLEMVSKMGVSFESRNPEGFRVDFDWSSLPLEVRPESSLLPRDRVGRKRQQLENLAVEVVRIARPGDVIVDFCCGTGHLGLALACALPSCHVVLLDNKEESLTIRAKAWADRLKLTNVSFFLGNIAYFNRSFDIGLSLHACGVATDIVLQKCMDARASFVCSPCCYGAIYETQAIKYPRSNKFRETGMTLMEYVYLAHAADQSHDPESVRDCNLEKTRQGEACMDIVDTDRKLAAEEVGYRVRLRRLHPENCTPKNRLLVGEYLKAR